MESWKEGKKDDKMRLFPHYRGGREYDIGARKNMKKWEYLSTVCPLSAIGSATASLVDFA